MDSCAGRPAGFSLTAGGGGWVRACGVGVRGCARRPLALRMRLAQAHSCFCAVLDKSTGLRH